MKRVITLLALLSVVALTGCKKDPADPVQLTKPTLSIENITEDGFTVTWNAVANAADYTVILNNETGVTQSETTKVFTGLAAGTYQVRVKANAPKNSKEFRDSDIASATATITAPEKQPLTFEFVISELTEVSAKLTVIPSDAQATYYFDNLSKAEFDQFNEPNDIRDYFIELFEELAAQDGLTLEETIEHNVSIGEDSWPPTGMTPGADYVVFAFGLNPDGTFTSDVQYKEYQTLANEDIEVTANVLVGNYYGDAYGEGMNYYITLSNNGFNDANVSLPNSWYYTIDLYGAEPETLDDVVIPAGTYTFDPDYTTEPGTFAAYESYFWKTDANNAVLTDTYIEDGTIVVTSTGITAEFVIMGATHTVTFEGVPSIGSANGPLSTLTEDLEADLSGSLIAYSNYGDYNDIGATNYVIQTLKSQGGDTFLIDFNTTGEGLAGTYTAGEEPEAGKFLAGSQGSGTWYRLTGPYGAATTTQAPLVDGVITITDNGNDNYTIEIDAYDDVGNHITASHTGFMQSTGVAPANVKGATKAPAKAR